MRWLFYLFVHNQITYRRWRGIVIKYPSDGSKDSRKECRKVKFDQFQGSAPRWWCRKTLISPPPTDTPKLQLYMEQFALGKQNKPKQNLNLRNWRSSPFTSAHKRETISKWVGKAEKQSHHKHHPPVWSPTIRRELKT